MYILNYKITDTIHQSEHTSLFLGIDENNQQKIVLKTSNRTEHSIEDDNRIDYEYAITNSQSNEYIPKTILLSKHNGKSVFVREYFEGTSLKSYLANHIFLIETFLSLASRMAETMGRIHQNNIIHKDINANNILYNPDSNSFRIIDFGIASKIDLKTQNLGNPSALEGTLPYISPEQTGRMNRIVDYRSDLYSLGITFYEMLTNQLPFKSDDPLEIIHSHIAKKPVSPQKIRADIPEMLSLIILKLLSKNAEERYQSALGLKYDLDIIYRQLLKRVPLIPFELGFKDYSIKFHIPQKLYGREKDIEKIINAFENTGYGNKNLVLLSGYSGVGKTALVSEVHKPMSSKRGFFLDGKFEQFQKNIPYFAWKQVFNKFADLILTESSENLEIWRKRILHAVGASAKVLTDFSPQLELVLGKQPELAELDNLESENRFSYVIKTFIITISRKEHPVVIFIDDWQWADIPSIKLFKNIISDKDIRFLLLIGAYRDNETDAMHPFMMELNLLKAGMEEQSENLLAINEIKLDNLSLENVETLVADTIGLENKKIQELAQLLYSKTKGNAFFINQLFKSLYEEEYVKQNYDVAQQKMYWHWDIDVIHNINITDNVVAFIIQKIRKMAEETKSILQLAACIGTSFDLKTMAFLGEKNEEIIQHHLLEALEEGFIIPLDTNKRQYSQFKFAHDRIRQAFYELMPENSKQKTHFKIANILHKGLSEEKIEEQIFDLVNHFNMGIDLVEVIGDKYKISALNLKASQKAQASAAYSPALEYAMTGIRLLEEDAWKTNYQLNLELHKEVLEDIFLMGDFEHTEEWLQIILTNAKTLLDKVIAYEIQINILKAQNKLSEALKLGLEVIKMLGINIPENPSLPQIIWQIIKTNAMLGINKHKKLLEAPLTKNQLHIAMERLMSTVSPLTYFLAPKIVPVLIAKQAQLAVKNGQTLYSPYSYSSYAMIMAGSDNIKFGYELGRLAEKLMSKLNPRKIEGRINFVLNICVKHWKEPLVKVVEDLRQSYLICMETGDFEFAGLCINVSTIYALMAGMNLKKLDEDLGLYQKILKEKTNQISKYNDSLVIQAGIILLLENPRPIKMYREEEVYEEEKVGGDLLKNNNLTNYLSYCYGKFNAYYYFNESEKALPFLREFEKYKAAATGTAFISTFYYLKALILLDLYPNQDSATKRKFWKEINFAQKKIGMWAKHSPENYQHKYDLIVAEKRRVSKKYRNLAKLYNEVIAKAQKNNYLNDKALVEELTSRLYFNQGMDSLGVFFLQNAYKSYTQWGATRKLTQLKEKFPQYLQKPKSKTSASLNSSQTMMSTSLGTNSKNLDFLSIVKSSQTISGEIVFSQLLEKMMSLVIENAGAERGLLILPQADILYIEAEIDLKNNRKEFLNHIPIDPDLIPENIIRFTARTLETTVLTNAYESNAFNNSLYIKEQKTKSILCMPLLKQGKLIGILYLENNLATDVFIQERTQVLQLLSSQMAISIENALLYENLEQKVKERTAEVVRQKEIIEDKNKNITDSINYAKRIQQAILPNLEDVRRTLPESFIFFQPRDIVSGDFYYFTERNDKIILAAVDCTGHGIPGAFMSLISNDLLSSIVEVEGQEEPGKILDLLRNGIKQTLKQEENNNQDGMDISLCVIDKKQRKLYFGGSNTLVYFQEEEMHVIRGDKIIIGGFRNYQMKQSFTQHSISLDKPTTFYIFTDGYQDQFGGPEGRKFTSPRMREFLKSIHHLPTDEQNNILKQNLEDWMYEGTHPQSQIDDILVIGVKI